MSESANTVSAGSMMPESPEALARLAEWLTAHVAGFIGPIRLERISGGQSNPTFKLLAGSGAYVLRMKPIGSLLASAHAIDREYRVLHALRRSGLPVPHVHALCTDATIIGSMFYVMEHVPGRTFTDPQLLDLAPTERAAIFDAMNATIAKLHSFDPASLGLADFGRPGPSIARQISRWTRQYRDAATGLDSAMEELIAWLPANAPAEREQRLVHGDFRLDNLLIHPTQPKVAAVVDWELSTLGDPLADFAYHLMVWRFTPELFRGLASADLAALGIPDETRYAEAYLARTGFERPASWTFYLVLSMFRIAAIFQGIARRAHDGTANDPDAAILGAKARPVAELAMSLTK